MTLFQTIMTVLLVVLACSLCLALWRLLQGPSIPDRAAAFDLMVNHVVGMIAIFVMVVGQLLLIDAVIIISVIGFLGTVALARFIEEGRN
jgi:multisubunit Na+/H+ antiporter MnhF subunit